MRQRIGPRTAAAGLALFALPLMALGLTALYMAVGHVATWLRMSTWDEVPAEIVSVELERSAGPKSAYAVRARYRYSYEGHDYTADRVAIGTAADNVGSFQRDLYASLSAAQQRGGRVRAYVDPAEPTEVSLNRDMRWLVLGFQATFALGFCGAGFGLLFCGRRFRARLGSRVLQPPGSGSRSHA
jgi:hypothetical protein